MINDEYKIIMDAATSLADKRKINVGVRYAKRMKSELELPINVANLSTLIDIREIMQRTIEKVDARIALMQKAEEYHEGCTES